MKTASITEIAIDERTQNRKKNHTRAQNHNYERKLLMRNTNDLQKRKRCKKTGCNVTLNFKLILKI